MRNAGNDIERLFRRIGTMFVLILAFGGHSDFMARDGDIWTPFHSIPFPAMILCCNFWSFLVSDLQCEN
jgi:hypothetical protein